MNRPRDPGLTGLTPKALLDAAPAGVWVVDEEGRTAYGNDTLVRLLGTSPSELLRTAPGNFFDASDRARAGSLLDPDQPSPPTSVVLRLRRTDGRLVTVVVARATWTHDDRGGVVLAVSPTTAPMRVMEELRDRERQLREAEVLGNAGTWEWSIDAHEFIGSEELYRIYGLMPGVVNLDLDTIVERTHPDDREMLRRRLGEIAAGEGDVSFERRIVRPDGEERIVHTTARVLESDTTGKPLRVLGVSRDVTSEQHALERRVRSRELYESERQVAERLREVDDLRSAFIDSVSSDLRAPLATVLGSAATLRDIGAMIDSETTDALLDQTIEQASHLDVLLSDLVDLERLRRSGTDLQLTRVPLGELVRRTVQTIDSPRVRLEIEDPDAEVLVDPQKIERVVENLVRNALRVGPEASSVSVSVSGTDRRASITVTDEGPTVPRALRREMFEMMSTGVSAEVPGRASLSLAIIGRYVRLHHGTILAEDQEGGGSRVVVTLPRHGDAVRRTTPIARPGEVGTG